MNPRRELILAAVLATLAASAPAQTPPAAGAGMAMPGSAADMTMGMMDDAVFAHVLFDRLEGRTDGARTDFRWDAQGWVGTDYNKLWIKTEGFARGTGGIDDGRHEFLYDRPITTYFDLQAGLRSDLDSHPSRHWAAFGLQGLAPYFFDVEATAYVSDQGHLAGRLHASYDLLITQRLILQPEAELNFYSRSDPARLVGAGLSDIDAGLRLRYEISRKFAPYLGVAFEGKFGQTAGFTRRAGENTDGVRLVLGLRAWF
jgi:copper resistance protein B